MMIHDITAQAGKYKKRKRIGRGESSGWGKTAGRGHKGAKSRSGYSAKKAFEGGQMPFFRRVAKRGFTNAQFRTDFWTVNLGAILDHPSFAKGGVVNARNLIEAGLIRDESRPLKVLGDLGDHAEKGVGVKLEITANRVSDSVRKLVTDAGGSVTETGTRRDIIRGIDRNSEDRLPTRLTKKPKQRAAKDFSHLDKGSQKGKGSSGKDKKSKKEGKAKDKPEGKSKGKGEGKKSKKD